MKNQNEKSIRFQLLCWLLVPLCTLWFFSTAFAYFLAVGFANDAYDRELLNSADSVAARLRSSGTSVWVDLPPAAQAILRHKDTNKFYYQVLKQDGTRISGDAFLPLPLEPLNSSKPVYRSVELNGESIRMARIRVDLPNSSNQTVLVQVAETLVNRQHLAKQIMLSIILPQLILITLGGFAVSIGISRGLKPLKKLENDLALRTQFDLTPVSEDSAPAEVRPLVLSINNLLFRLRQDIETQHRFVANAAHQFRTPLAGLKAYVYAAKRLSSENQMNAVLDRLESGIDRIVHLSDKLLALAKAEPTSKINRHEKVDLNFVVSETTSELVTDALVKNIDLTFEASENPALIIGDSGDIGELSVNLIENAISYTQDGGHVLVRISNGASVNIMVQDDGPGIPIEDREKVFERFYRVLGTGAPGSGLGLAIVKEIASAHRGAISINSGADGKGTIFTVSFPPAR